MLERYTKEKVYASCKIIAPEFGFDPDLIFAVCLQEGAKKKDGSFSPDIARLEQGYYRKYVETQNEIATSSEILLSASYGVMQLMGLSLKEAGYFQWYFDSRPQGLKDVLKYPLSQFAVPNALDFYCVNLDLMIRYGCIWMDKKRKLAKGNERLMLQYWNGSAIYPNEVYEKLKTVKAL